MMHERQMLPIVFPHMTSFSPLPMLSFCTVQYDWEWRYSEGDVHDRFPRDYVQLVTTGEQAGVWPVPLSDATCPKTRGHNGPSRPCASSTNSTAVAGGGEARSRHKDNAALAQSILDMLDREGLQVYRYWDERPQPLKAANPDVAISVSGAADIRIYWDGQERTRHSPKGRIFKEGEINAAELGHSGNRPAMTLDEIVVLDRALSADEVLAYVTAVKALAQVKFPVGRASTD